MKKFAFLFSFLLNSFLATAQMPGKVIENSIVASKILGKDFLGAWP